MIIWSILYISFTIVFGIRLRSWNDEIPGQCYITSGIAAPSGKHPYVDHIYISITCFYVISSFFLSLGINSYIGIYSAKYRGHIKSATHAMNGQLRQHLHPEYIELLNKAKSARDAMDRRLRRNLSPDYIEALNKAIPLLRDLYWGDPDAKQTMALGYALLQYPIHTYSVFMIRAMNESHLVQGSTEQDWGFGQVVAVTLLGSNVVILFEGISSMCLLYYSVFSYKLT